MKNQFIKTCCLSHCTYVLISICSALMTYWLSLGTLRTPLYDAALYFELAKHIHGAGLLLPSFEGSAAAAAGFELRTYLYPWILSVLDPYSGAFFYRLLFLQWAIYLYAAYLISHTILRIQVLQRVGFAVLALNPLIVVYCSYILTDSLCTSLLLITLALIIKAARNQPYYIILAWACTAMAMMIRPAAIFILPLTGMITLLIFYQYKSMLGKLYILFFSILSFVVPLSPQLYINWTYFNAVSFLPLFDLGGAQVQWGILYLKYATDISGLGSPQMFYPNMFLTDTQVPLTFNWYFENSINAVKTLFFKLIGAFHFDYLRPYISDLHPKTYWITTMFSTGLFVLGLLGLWFKKSLQMPYIISVLFLLGWAGIHLLSAVELRFTLSALAVLSLYAVYAGLYFIKLPSSSRKKMVYMVATMMYITFLWIGHIIFQQRLIH